jgi:hypothetical protein
MAESKDHFSDTHKLAMLQNAVHPIEELRAVQVQADQKKVLTNLDLTYEHISS